MVTSVALQDVDIVVLTASPYVEVQMPQENQTPKNGQGQLGLVKGGRRLVGLEVNCQVE
jgi:hypothetical protein